MIPTSNKIFIQPLDKKVTSLIIPPKYEYRSKEFLSGIVLMKGSGVTEVEVGDEVAYTKDFGVEVELEDKKFVVITSSHILAIA